MMAHHRSVKPNGLTQVYIPPRGEHPAVDIVFVHGLNGHPESSWSSKTSGCFWPVDLLPDVLGPLRPRILTYGYNASVAAFTDGASRDSIVSHAETLASTLAANRNLRSCTDRPIIFVCHSLGGLVVKRALIYSRSLSDEEAQHLRSVYVSTFGILFLGTPHNGPNFAKWGLLLHNICTSVLPKRVMEGSPQLIKALETNNETLQHINSLFADIMSHFHLYFFHESRLMDAEGTREIIVDQASAAPHIEGVERSGIEADHSHMCKFDDENSPGYDVIAEAILKYSRHAPSAIADRWIEERNTRSLEKKVKAREIYDGTDDPLIQSMPEMNAPATSYFVPNLSQDFATDDRNPPVSELGNNRMQPLSRSLNNFSSQKEAALFVAPPGFHPNASFFGMQKELEELHRGLFEAKARVERTMAVLIAGMPGSGKTHLARQYAFAQRECYTGGIFWVDAKSRKSTSQCVWNIAQAATLMNHEEAEDPSYQQSRTYVNAVRNWLQSRHDWLLIFDGITFDHDDDINDFRPFLPCNKGGNIIYTSTDAMLRRERRLFEPYCLSMPRLKVEDACRLLYRDLGIRRPTPEQASKATKLVEYYECLPLAIHAIGHRLNATGKPVERYSFKHRVTEKKLAEPFLAIMNDLYRLKQKEALNLFNLLSFLSHRVSVGLLVLGRSIMAAENAEIISNAQLGQDPGLDNTLSILLHYGLIEGTSDADSSLQPTGSALNSNDEMYSESKVSSQLTDSFSESSKDSLFPIYWGNSAGDIIEVHSVVQGFCRDELKIKDEEYKDLNKQSLGFYESWLIVATRFLCRSYETAKEKIAHYHDHGLVHDYREYETHASHLIKLFPKERAVENRPRVLRDARESLRELMKSISSEIDRISTISPQEPTRNQRSVFGPSNSLSSSFHESLADDGGIIHRATWTWTQSGSPYAEPPEELMVSPQFRLELFPPHPSRQPGSESNHGCKSDSEPKEAPQILPAYSQMRKPTETARQSFSSSSLAIPQEDSQGSQTAKRHSTIRSSRQKQRNKQSRWTRRFPAAKQDNQLLGLAPIQAQGSSSRVPSDQSESSSILASVTETALAAVRPISNGSSSALSSNHPCPKQNHIPTYANVAAGRIFEAKEALTGRPASMSVPRGLEVSLGPQRKASADSLNSQASGVFTSPLSHEIRSHKIVAEPLTQSNYGVPYRENMGHSLGALDLHTAPTSVIKSRRPSTQANIEAAIRDMTASTPSVFPYEIPAREPSANTLSLGQHPHPISPYEQDITITIPHRRSIPQCAPAPMAPGPAPVAHPSPVMPRARPLSTDASDPAVVKSTKRLGSEALSRSSSGFSHLSWSTEPVRYPPRFSPASSLAQSSDITRRPTPLLDQQHTLSSAGSWHSDRPLSKSASVQPDSLYPVSPPTQRRLSSVDERLRTTDLAWNAGIEAAELLHFGGHRVDVRNARERLHEAATRRHVPTYQLYHSGLSGRFVRRGGHVYLPVPAPEVYTRPARNWTESLSARVESPDEMMAAFLPKSELSRHISSQSVSESDDGYETHGEAKEAHGVSPALSRISQTRERRKQSPISSDPSVPQEDSPDRQLVERNLVNPSMEAKQPNLRPHISTEIPVETFHLPRRPSSPCCSGSFSVRSIATDISSPDLEDDSIDSGITSTNDMRHLLDSARYVSELDKLELRTAQILGLKDTSHPILSSVDDCLQTFRNWRKALQHLQSQSFCGSTMSLLVEDKDQNDISKAVHVSLDQIDTLEKRLMEPLNAHAIMDLTKTWSHQVFNIQDGVFADVGCLEFLRILCQILSIGLLSFSGSHVCRFDVNLWNQEMKEIRVGFNGYSFKPRKLACLEDFIGGPAWVLSRTRTPVEIHEQPLQSMKDRQALLETQETRDGEPPMPRKEGEVNGEVGIKIALTVQDLQELWGPVSLVGGTRDEAPALRTERGFVVPVPQRLQSSPDGIECHWTAEIPEYLSKESPNTPKLRPTSKILIGTTIKPETGLMNNEKCESSVLLVQQEIAYRLQYPGTCKSRYVSDGYDIQLVGGQYITTGFMKKYKRIPKRTLKAMLVEDFSKPDTKLVPLLNLWVGLEVSACTGNAQRVRLWDALRLSQTSAQSEGSVTCCTHAVGSKDCITSCWTRWHSDDEIDSLGGQFRPKARLSGDEARRVVIHSVLALEHTGVDNEGNLQVCWPFSHSPANCTIMPSSPRGSHHWFRVVKDSRHTSTFAVFSQRCLEFPEQGLVRSCCTPCRVGHSNPPQTILATRIVTITEERLLSGLIQGARFVVGEAHLTVTKVVRDQLAIIAAISKSPLSRLREILPDTGAFELKEHIRPDITTDLSVPVFAY